VIDPRCLAALAAPTFDDWDDLPETWGSFNFYLHGLPTQALTDPLPCRPYSAFVLESYRWRPVLPAGLAHAVTETFTYNGMVIPKGAIITGNTWSVHRDPSLFDAPDEFQPERWLTHCTDGARTINREMKHTQFGFGRR